MPRPGILPRLLLPVLMAASARAQNDALVSKQIDLAVADSQFVYVFGAGGDGAVGYSRIDVFRDPVEIRTQSLPLEIPLQGGIGREQSALLFFNVAPSDSLLVSGLVQLHRNDKTGIDSLIIARPEENRTRINDGVRFSSLARAGPDTLVLGAGRAGFAVSPLNPGDAGSGPALNADSLRFSTLPEGRDSAVTVLGCALNVPCEVDTLSDVAQTLGEPDSVASVAVAAEGDSAWLLIGTQRGLRRGLLGSENYPEVSLPGVEDTADLAVDAVAANPASGIVWVFSRARYFYSEDYGRSFRVPPDPEGAPYKPSEITGFTRPPEVVFHGDTSYIDFFLDEPGLIAFRRDSVLANEGEGLSGLLIAREDGLDVSRENNRLSAMTAVARDGRFAPVLGSTAKGLFYRFEEAGSVGEWRNENKLRGVKGSLAEVITYPTLFTGRTASGDVEYVRIGYRLDKDARVTITVYNYAMEKVKTVVRNAPRKGGVARSENPDEDKWDGRDAGGRFVSVGTYYILVESDRGEKGWGKAIAARGR